MTATATRADDVRTWVDLAALSGVIVNISIETLGVEDMDDVRSIERGSMDEIFCRLWPEDDDTERLEHLLAEAECETIMAETFAWLASHEGRTFCERETQRLAVLARENVKRAREMADAS